MSNSKGNAHEFSLKVYVNKQNTKVLFAEADRDFVEVLISFLTLPLGTIVRVLRKHYGDNHDSAPVFGSITTLYDGISKLDSVNFWTEGCKEVLLNPIRSTFEDEYRILKVDINDNQQPNESFTSSCGNPKCGNNWASCRSVYYDTAKCVRCQKIMTRKVDERQSYGSSPLKISDDLHILPSTVGFVQTVRNLGLTNTDVGTPRDVTLGYNEIMDLLKRSLVSETPISDVILNKREVAKEATDSNSEPKLILKVMVHSPSNKLLYAQADDDFINFLFSSLAVPLGAVESVAGGNPCLKNINNLHKSIPNILNDKIAYKYLNTKERLMNPKLPHGYIPENPILPFTEECESNSYRNVCLCSANFPKGKGKYVKGPLMYNISDDLTVTPFCLFSFLSFLEREKIDVSDVKELELEIGVEEVISISI
ncbi:hypothetical protein MIMGU_mgv1a021208mg [Erythranthe guttata]|uniref:DUF674 domain-containing protein n=1 Tax=Erythranthe guttata TaxID=4155 RepID=A0A022R5C1_ERYGU|nr:hypothetical protein MIMGU_mgv1a021208mg [Erythranthe guttata]